MSFLFAQPQLLMDAATDLAGISSTLNAANAAAVLPTTSVMAAGADDISAVVATMFGAHAQQYQAMSAQAANLHTQFVQAMNGASSAYADAEAANAKPMQPGAPTPQGSSASAPAPVGRVGYSGAPVSSARAGRSAGLLSGNRGNAGAAAAPSRVGNSGNVRPIATGGPPAGVAPLAASRERAAGGSGVITAGAKRTGRSFGNGGAGARGTTADLVAR